jgi:RNA-directed DNA polymerase
MSQPARDTPRPFQPPVAQRDIKAEVIHCVGGVISPCLRNVALHGMEHAAGVRYRNSNREDAETVRGCPVLVRYADDFAVMCYRREQAEQVQARLAAWLEPRGLRFSEAKTRIVHAEDGFSFLGFDIRRHVDRQGSGKLLITPGKEQVKRLRERLSAEVRAMRGRTRQPSCTG